MKTKVELVEFERGWGQKVDSVKVFNNRPLAEKFVKKYNSKNTEKVAPDWYMIARIVE